MTQPLDPFQSVFGSTTESVAPPGTTPNQSLSSMLTTPHSVPELVSSTKKQFSDNKTIQTARNVINSYWKYAHPELGVIQDTASDLKNTVGRLYDISVSGEKDFQTKKELVSKRKDAITAFEKIKEDAIARAFAREEAEKAENIAAGQSEYVAGRQPFYKRDRVVRRLMKSGETLSRIQKEGLSKQTGFDAARAELSDTRRTIGNLSDLVTDKSRQDAALEKMKSGEQLSPEEAEMMLKIMVEDVTAEERHNLRYESGAALAGSLGFLMQLVPAERAVAGITTKIFPKLSQQLAKRTAKNLTAKGIFSGTLAPSFMPSTITGAQERTEQKISYDINTDEFTAAPGKDWGEALARQYGSNAVEVLTERIGTVAGQILGKSPNKVMTTDFLRRLFLAKTTGKTTTVKKLMKEMADATHYDGVLMEVFEEEVGAPFSALINEENYDLPTEPEGIKRMLMSAFVAFAYKGGAITLEKAEEVSDKYSIKFDKDKLGFGLGAISIENKEKTAELVAEKETYKRFAEFITERTGKKVTPEQIEARYLNLKTQKKVADFEGYIRQTEAILEKEQKKAEKEIEKQGKKDIIVFTEEVDGEIEAIAEDPRLILKELGYEAGSRQKAREMFRYKSSETVQQLGKIAREANFALGIDVEAYDIQEVILDKMNEIEEGITERKEKNKNDQRARLKHIPATATAEQRQAIEQENKLIQADFALKKKNQRIKELQERPSEVQQMKKELRDFTRGWKKGSKDTQKKLKILQQSITNFARKHLPKSELGKQDMTGIMSRITSTKTAKPQDVAKAISYVAEVAERSQKKAALKQFEKTRKAAKAKKQGGIIRTPLTPEANEVLAGIKKFSDLSLAEAQERQEMNSVKLEADQTRLDLVLENEALSYAGIKEMTAQEIMENVDRLKALLSGARKERKAAHEAKRRRTVAISTATKNTMTGEQFKTKHKKPGVMADTVAEYFESFMSLSDSLSRHDKGSDVDQSFLSKTAEMAFDAALQSGRISLDFQEINSMIAKEVFGEDVTVKELRRTLEKDFKKEKNLGKFENHKGEKVDLKLSGYEMASFVMSWRQDATREIMEQTRVRRKNGDKFKVSDVLAETVLENAPEKLIEYLEKTQKEILRPLRNMLAPLIEMRTGLRFPSDPTYFPRSSEFDVIQTAEEMIREQIAFSSGLPSSAKSRSKKTDGIMLQNPVSQVMKQISQISHYVGHFDFVNTYSALFADKTWTETIEDTFSKNFLDAYKKSFESLVSGKPTSTDSGIEKASDWVFDRVVVAQLGAKLSIMIKQLTSFPAFLAGSSPAYFVADVAEFLTAPKKHGKFLYNNSEWLSQRIDSGKFEQDIDKIGSSDAARKLLQKKSLGEILMGTIKLGDAGAIMLGGWHTYKQALRDGKTQAEAIRVFELKASKDQQESAMYARNRLQNIKLLRGLRTYKTTLFQYFQSELKYLRAFKNKRGTYKYSDAYTKKFEEVLAKTATSGQQVTEEDIAELAAFAEEKAKRLPRIARIKKMTNHLLSFLLFHSFLNMFFTWVGDGFEFKKDKQLRAAILGNIGAIPLVGDVLIAAWGSLFLKENFGRGNILGDALWQLPDTIKSIAKTVSSAVDGGASHSEVKKMIKESAMLAGLATKTPVSGLVESGAGLFDLATGRTRDPRRLILSEWSVGNPKQELFREIEKNGNTTKAKDMFHQLQKDGEYATSTTFSEIYHRRKKLGKAAKAKKEPKQRDVFDDVFN